MAEVICSQVIDELTEMMNMNKEQVEKTVHESKCDELSAMFNMMMDNKRKDKGRSSIINHRMQKPRQRFILKNQVLSSIQTLALIRVSTLNIETFLFMVFPML